jgi:hypothetical protein
MHGEGTEGKRRRHTSKQHTPQHADRQSPLGNRDIIIRLQLPHISRIIQYYNNKRDDFADNHSEIRETRDAGIPAVLAVEDERVGSEEEVQEPVDEGHVDGLKLFNQLDQTMVDGQG